MREKRDNFGLGYDPSWNEVGNQYNNKQIPSVEEMFTSVGHIFGN